MKNSNLQKKIKKLKKLYVFNFELKGFFISNRFFEIKKKKEKKIKPVQYIKTNRYVIPLPSDEDNSKNKKPKKKILFFTKFQDLYSFYENFFKNQWLFFYFTPFSIYNPNKIYYLNKFDHGLKFEIFWMLKSTYCLLSESSFSRNFSKKYFSVKKFKFFSLVYFRDMFQKYWNPNLPLLWRKGENFTSKIEGTALLKLWEIIFRELVFEKLNLQFKYSELDLKTFSLANIDPYDNWYYWKTWWLYLIGLSIHDGKISYNHNRKFYKDFSDIPTSEIKNDVLLSLKKQVLAQFLFWKEKLIKLANSGYLFYDVDKMFKLNSNFFNLNHKIIKNFIFFKPCKYEQLNLFLENKFWKQNSLSYFESSIPEYYFGKKFEFLTNNYFSTSTDNLVNDVRFSALFETDLNWFLKKFKLNDTKMIFKIFYTNFSSYKIENFNKKFNKMILIKKPEKGSFFKKTTFLVEKNSELTPGKVLSLLKNNIKNINGRLTSKYIYPIPDFIKYLFLLLIQCDIDSQDLDYFYINPFLHNFIDFKKAKKEAKQKMKENLGILWSFEYYFKISSLYNLKDPTLAYKIFMKNLGKFPNKDICLRREEPFGLNPFEFTIKFLSKIDVPFPEAVDYYTYYKAKKKEKILTLKNTLIKKNYIYFFLKILNSNSIFNFCKNLFFFEFKQRLWFKKKIYVLKNKCIFNFKIKNTFTLESNFYFDKINGSNLTDSLDFLWFNAINYNNFTENQLLEIWLKNSTKIKVNFFTKILDKWKTQFIFNKMHNILSINFFFQNTFTSKNILHSMIFNKNYYLKFNFFSNKKNFYFTNQFIVYKFNYMDFLKTYYFSKFFFYNFSFLFKLILKNY